MKQKNIYVFQIFFIILIHTHLLSAFSLEHLGTSYGGWTIPTNCLDASSVCYCIGAGEDLSFDVALIEKFNCNVYTFDPTPRSIAHVKCLQNYLIEGKPAFITPGNMPYTCSSMVLEKLHFYPYGLWKFDGPVHFYTPKNPQHVSHSLVNAQQTNIAIQVPCKTLRTIMRELSHDHIDLLKLDIEGAEYEVLENIIEQKIYPNILCVEFHKLKDYSKEKYINLLKEAGYFLIHQQKGTDFTFMHYDMMHKSKEMILHEYYTDLFATDPVTTEYDAYKLLKENPLQQHIHYLAIPWAVLINKKQLHTVPNIHLPGGFTICQHIKFREIIPLLEKIGIDTLFTPHVQKNVVYSKKIKVLPFPHYAVNGTDPHPNKDLLYSFVGANTHKSRATLFKMKVPKDAIVKERKSWHWWGNKDKQQAEEYEYKDLLARSRFSLCPRGTGASTIRFWESLQAGAIPVLIADDFVLPAGYNWKTCLIQVAEKNVEKINTILSGITPKKEALMRQKCFEAYNLFSDKNFISNIRLYYNTLQSQNEEV